ncbi:asparagine synthase-related protein [Halobacterium yunchengense]|uniref:asparagine synthase-related protein n=1 Tax=Halobacterium yunchengense TaxID=3108497 RepID=UPI003009EDF3
MRGHAFYKDEYQDAENLASLVQETDDVEELSEFLSSLNGFFSVVVDADDETVLASDRMRTGPVFYSVDDGKILVSDDCGWMTKETPPLTRSKVSEVEYETSRFVTSSNTLYKEISQLQSGEIVVFDKSSADISTYQHHTHTTTNSRIDEDELRIEFQRVLDAAFERLIDAADGRPIAVPLSGGYDSRLIALMLKRLEYENVITYTVNTGGDTLAIAERVAENLGFPWVTANVTHDEWGEFYNSDTWDEFFHSAAYLGGLPSPTEVPALMKLKRLGKIPEDALFVPGHSALDSMKATPEELERANDIQLGRLTDHIVDQHFKYNESTRIPSCDIESRVAESIGMDTSIEPRSSVEAFERWRLKERRAKLIINGSRVYDFLGWDWWMPLEDEALYEFWRRVPMSYKRHRSFYEEYIKILYADIGAVSIDEAKSTEDDSFKLMVADKLRGSLIWPLVSRSYALWDNSWMKQKYMVEYKLEDIYQSDPRYGIMSKSELKEYYDGQSYIFFSLLSRDTLEKIDLGTVELS